jgi:hypothetical protein
MGRTSQTDPKPSSNHGDKLAARVVTRSSAVIESGAAHALNDTHLAQGMVFELV